MRGSCGSGSLLRRRKCCGTSHSGTTNVESNGINNSRGNWKEDNFQNIPPKPCPFSRCSPLLRCDPDCKPASTRPPTNVTGALKGSSSRGAIVFVWNCIALSYKKPLHRYIRKIIHTDYCTDYLWINFMDYSTSVYTYVTSFLYDRDVGAPYSLWLVVTPTPCPGLVALSLVLPISITLCVDWGCCGWSCWLAI